MKEESVLESAGPLFIAAALVGVLVLVTWLMVRGQGDWGKGAPMTAAHAVSEDAGH